MEKNKYFYQVDLLLKILPLLAGEKHFALKGGTAINLFIRDFPRYSVDIDLTYLPIEDREISLATMSNSLDSLAGEIARLVPGTSVQKKSTGKDKRTSKLFVSRGNDLVKIEPNEILRGYVYPPKEQKLSPVVANTFSVECSTLLVNIADLYAGKICAALDRQHPRDLFDIKLLLENEGVTEEIKKAFVIYLVSHGRPMNELLKPNFLDIQDVYESQFKGMTKDPVAVSDLTSARERLVLTLNKSLQDEEKDFILSIADGDPKWDLIDFEHVKELPALRWKLQNVASMDKTKRLNAVKKLAKVLEAK